VGERESACNFGAWVESGVRIEGARGTHVSQGSQRSASLTRRDELLDATERGEEKDRRNVRRTWTPCVT
jgi:hypothetical protein